MKTRTNISIAILGIMSMLIAFQWACKKENDPDNNNNDPDPVTGTVTDIDGNDYKTVKIGNQVWMAEDLLTSRYNDGSAIVDSNDLSPKTALTGNTDKPSGYYYYYQARSDKICPQGWHMPTKDDWTELYGFIAHDNGGAYGGKEGKALKSKESWTGEYTGDDVYGFNARAMGAYNPDSAKVTGIGKSTYILSKDKVYTGPWIRVMYNFNNSFHETTGWFEAGYTVRCLKDD